MTAQSLGWGPPGCSAQQLVRLTHPGLVDHPPYFPVRVRREVAPLFLELIRWLVTERARLGLPPLTSSGGYNKRLQRGSTTKWSNHSWGLAVDFNAATNPMRRPLRTDMPPGAAAKAKALGMRWGGDYSGTPDPMHFEVVVSPGEAARIARSLTDRADRTREDDDMTPQQAQQLAQLATEMDGLRRDLREFAVVLSDMDKRSGGKGLTLRDPSTPDRVIES